MSAVVSQQDDYMQFQEEEPVKKESANPSAIAEVNPKLSGNPSLQGEKQVQAVDDVEVVQADQGCFARLFSCCRRGADPQDRRSELVQNPQADGSPTKSKAYVQSDSARQDQGLEANEEDPERPRIPIQNNQQPLEQEGFVRRMLTCRCSRGREIAGERNNELVNADEHDPGQPAPPAEDKTSFVNKFDDFLSKLTPYYILTLYYLVFASLGWLLYNLWVTGYTYELKIIFGFFIFSQVFKLVTIMSADDEWQDQLPYIDSMAGNSARQVFIYICTLLNLDIIYWVYLIYYTGRRDEIIEYMQVIHRLIDAIVMNTPLMVFATYTQLSDTDVIQIDRLVIIFINMLSIVNAFYQMNFFNGTSYSAIKWTIQSIAQLYLKTLLLVTAYLLLDDYDIQYEMLGIFALFGTLQFIFFNDFSESYPGTIASFYFYQIKTLLCIRFREHSFYDDPNFDTEAQPHIFPLNKNIAPLTFSLSQIAFNMYSVIQLSFLILLFNGFFIIIEDRMLQLAYGIGAGCLLIQMLSCLNIVYKNMRGQIQAKKD